MAIDKVIKKFNNDNFVYLLGYDLYDDKISLEIEIYKDKRLLSGGYWSNGAFGSSLDFYAVYFSSYKIKDVSAIKEMFTWLRQYSEIPKEIEKEFESLFLLYKLNDFKEI